MPERAETQSSGALVPKPIMTMPITKGDMQKSLASRAAASTKKSLDQASATSPPITSDKAANNGMSVYIKF
jgi:hypothetical protein